MASRKNLKKVIGYISSELLSQAIYVALNSDREAAEWNQLFENINNFLAKAFHLFNIFFIFFFLFFSIRTIKLMLNS